jgi:MFS family permease
MSDIRTLWLSSLGSALEFYDFIIFIFFTAVIGKLFFPSDLPDWLRQLQTYGIFAVGYLARPLGGIVMGHFGDIYGRKRMFTLSVLLMAIPTFLIGFLPVYKSIGIAAPLLLLLMRIRVYCAASPTLACRNPSLRRDAASRNSIKRAASSNGFKRLSKSRCRLNGHHLGTYRSNRSRHPDDTIDAAESLLAPDP